uniref:Malate synthase n=1 Tax=Picea sitchensis TaxID=3332 RepID=B8LRM2_PICSI|nr:unknown [Picea sitchensis]
MDYTQKTATKTTFEFPDGVRIRGRIEDGYEKILSKEALQFVADLQRTFGDRVSYNMACRKEQQARYNKGELPGFDPSTKAIREGDWICSATPKVVADRRVEITGPVERKMIINALNSGAKVFMSDFEDCLCPTWDNIVRGHINLKDAVEGTITYEDKARNRTYKLNDKIAVLFVRPRGWHLPEAHIEIDGQPATGCLVDFGLYFYHNHATFRLKNGGSGPFFYLPKMEHSREAALWNAIFEHAQDALGVPRGSIKATVLIETLPAVFQMHEILYELREHSIGLNCGRWDYIFSYIKTFQAHSNRLVPDRVQVGMTQHFMKSYSELLIQTCHKRGVHAMGGMAAQIPIKDDPQANEAASALVQADKLREVKAGHDGTWAAHPGLISVIADVFDKNMKQPNQINLKREDVKVSEEDLLEVPKGVRTLEGLRLNTRVGIQYLAAWLTGMGSVPLYNLMEDAATVEISRVQNWQWIHYEAILDGEVVPMKVTCELASRILDEEMARIQREVGMEHFKSGRYEEAQRMFGRQCTAQSLDDFLTLDVYKSILQFHSNPVTSSDM